MRKYSSAALLPCVAFAGSILALTAAPAFAQDYRPYGPYDAPAYGAGPGETVEVYGHRHPGERSRTTGADTIDVAFSRTINADKYDLRTRWGAHMFRERLLNEALITCSQLNIVYVSATPEENSACYQRTAGHAMEDADAAIDRARGFAER